MRNITACILPRILLGGASLALAAIAHADSATPPKDPPLRGNDCVFFSTVYDWEALDDQNLVIWAPSKRDAYQVYLSFPSPDIRGANTLGFVDGNHDGRLCGFGMDAIVAGDGALARKYSIAAMKKLDDGAIAALEKKYNRKISKTKKKQKPAEPARETAQ